MDLGFWLREFGSYLNVMRVLSDLFTIVLIATVVVLLAGLFFLKKDRRWLLKVAVGGVILLVPVAAAYAVVGGQFRSQCLRTDDALAQAVPVFPGARLTATSESADYNNGDAPIAHYLSVTHLFPLAWNYGRTLRYDLPSGTTAADVLRFYEPHFKGWNAPTASKGDVPDFYWRPGGAAVEIVPHDKATGMVVSGDEQVDELTLSVNGWNRPQDY